MASAPKESPANNPGLHATPDDATKGYIMQQTVRLLPIFYNTHFCVQYPVNFEFGPSINYSNLIPFYKMLADVPD